MLNRFCEQNKANNVILQENVKRFFLDNYDCCFSP